MNESCVLELIPTWNCFSSTKLHRAVREGAGRRVEVTLDFEAAATSLHTLHNRDWDHKVLLDFRSRPVAKL